MEPTSKSNPQNTTNALPDVLESIGLTPDQKAQTLKNLSQAIYLNMLYRLSSRLSDTQKDELEKKQPQGEEEVIETLSNFFTKDEITTLFESAQNDVLGRFLDQV